MGCWVLAGSMDGLVGGVPEDGVWCGSHLDSQAWDTILCQIVCGQPGLQSRNITFPSNEIVGV